MLFSLGIEPPRISYFHALIALTQLELLGFHFWTPSGGSHHQAPYRAPWIPAALGKHITYWLRDDLLTLFFLFWVMPIIGIFGNLTLTFVKRVRYPLCWWSYPSPSLSFLLSIPFLRCTICTEKLQQLISKLKLTVPLSTTQGKMRLYLHIRVQLLALY